MLIGIQPSGMFTEFMYKISWFLYKGDGKSEIKVKLRGRQLERYVKAVELSVTIMLLLAPRGEWHTARNELGGVGMCSCKSMLFSKGITWVGRAI